MLGSNSPARAYCSDPACARDIFPLGATWTGLGVNFALFSAHATKVELCLFDEQGEREIERIELPEFTDEAKGSRRDDRVRSRFAEARLDANGTLRIYRG
jgi:pullulanase/glycogen debranching enzyme